MGTRAVIRIDGVYYAEVYKHWDGDLIEQWLRDFNRDFEKNRGNDPEYKLAQLLRDSVRKANLYPAMDDSLYTGWGVLPYGSCGDYAIMYTLKSDGTVTVNG